jgi:hypothetical protein
MFLTLKAMVLQSKQIKPVIKYKGFTIVEDFSSPSQAVMFFPTEQGIDHDWDGERYVGNCKWASCIEEAKDEIMEKIVCSKPLHKVETKSKVGTGFNITKFEWLEDAVKFATMFNGVLKTEFESI